MFFGILFACLGRLADLLANNLPLVILVLLDRVQQRLALVLSKLGIVHVLVPVLLDRSLCPGGECLGDLSPAVSRISHLLEP